MERWSQRCTAVINLLSELEPAEIELALGIACYHFEHEHGLSLLRDGVELPVAVGAQLTAVQPRLHSVDPADP